MKGFHSHPTQQHKCQIDCTNHEEVINNLENKSKDLYYFWRNYEWLYQRYYSRQQVEDNSVQLNQLIGQLDEEKRRNLHLSQQIERLTQENRKLQSDNQGLRHSSQNNKQQPSRNVDAIEEDYKREVSRLKNKLTQYEQMANSLQNDVNTLQRTLTSVKSQLQEERQRSETRKNQFQAERQEYEHIIEDLRLKIASNIPSNIIQQQPQQNNSSQILYRHSLTQCKEVSSAFREIKTEAMRIVDEEMQMTRSELKAQLLSNIMGSMRVDLQTFIIDDDQQ